jgi:glycosyltransferase involved in cell wall biosynthesis
MKASLAEEPPFIVLLGNYPQDRQESMLRFRDLMQKELEARGNGTTSLFPEARLGRLWSKGFFGKWIAYVDKYVLFPFELRRRLAEIKRQRPGQKIVVHICDHANAVYAATARRWFPVLVTCHDLLAVRGALGEDTYCPASRTGRLLQAAILRGIHQATLVACVSQATRADLIRLSDSSMAGRSLHIPLSLNYPYRPLPQEEAMLKLKQAGITLAYRGYVLHVGSGHPRKNRKALLHAVALIKETWSGALVFAGEKLSEEEKALVRLLGLEDRVQEIRGPDNETVLALYSAAHGLIFMSYSEGFGWPILEAQASGCPVICSNRTSVPEVAGEGGLVHDPEDFAGVAGDIERLTDPAFREEVVNRGLKNAQAYTTERMIRSYEDAYRWI